MTILADARLRVTVAVVAVLALVVPAGTLAQHAGRDDTPRDVTLGSPRARTAHRGSTYDDAGWTSPWVRPGRDFTALIPSWNATTADCTWMEIWARARTSGGRAGGWVGG